MRIANSDPKIAKTRGFPIDLGCCGSSTSTEVNHSLIISYKFFGINSSEVNLLRKFLKSFAGKVAVGLAN